jgi:hypothetical protein
MKNFKDLVNAAKSPLSIPAELAERQREQQQEKINRAEEILKGIPVRVSNNGEIVVSGTADGTFKNVTIPQNLSSTMNLVIALNDFQKVCREHAMRVLMEEV